MFQETEYGALVSSAPRLAPSSWNWTPRTVIRPMTLTLALTGTVSETIDPEAGDVIATIRLPSPSCAWAWVEIRESPEIASSAAAPTRLPTLSMDYSFLAPLFSPDYYPPTIKGP